MSHFTPRDRRLDPNGRSNHHTVKRRRRRVVGNDNRN